MLAHELRTGDELRNPDGTLVYRITRAWNQTREGKPLRCADVRYPDGGDGTREFDPLAEVPHVRPTPRERVERYLADRERMTRGLGDRVHECHGGDEAGGSTLFLADLRALLAELDAARSYID
jgi:hypothetical protein